MTGYTDYRHVIRNKQNIYECPPTPPIELQCSVCHTAERSGSNIWDSVPFLSYSTFCGPTIADILIHILNLLPLSVISWLGLAHPKSCVAKEPRVVKYEPINKKTRKLCPDSLGRGGHGEGSGERLSEWMREEYMSLAKDLADLGMLTCEDGADPNSHGILNARNYVLDRLAEMLAKREEIERRMKDKKKKK